MKRSFGLKVLGCTVGAGMVIGGIGASMPPAALAQGGEAADGPIDVWQRAAVDYDKVANVQGGFTFTQDTLTPVQPVRHRGHHDLREARLRVRPGDA